MVGANGFAIGRESPTVLRAIDANQIVALGALLRHRNVTRAAREVGLGQPAMSHTLSRLRSHFDDPLLVRAGRDLVLTERAKGLIAPVSDAVAQLERVFARPEPFDPRTSRRVFRIAAADGLELFVLPRLAATLATTAPGIDVQVSALTADWAGALRRGDIDLTLGGKRALPEGLEGQDFSAERLAGFVRGGLSTPARPTLEDYAAMTHVCVAPSATPGVECSGIVDEVLRERGVRRRIAITVPHFLVGSVVVASSDMVMTAPQRLSPFTTSLRLRMLELPFAVDGYRLSQAWAARSGDDAGHRWLRGATACAVGP